MKARKTLYSALGLAMAAILLQACATVYDSHWQPDAGDSSFTDIPAKQYAYEATNGIMYRMSNSKDSLFIDLRFPDKLTRMKVLGFGMTVWIDPAAKNNKRLGIEYPMGNRELLVRQQKNMSVPDVKEGEAGMLELDYTKKRKSLPSVKFQNTEMRLIGFSGAGEITKQPVMHSDIRPVIRFDSARQLRYHLSLALEKISSAVSIPADSVVSVGIVTGRAHPPKMQDRPDQRRRQGGMYPTGGTRYGGSMNHGAMRDHHRSLAQPAQLWIKKLRLASPSDGPGK